MIFIVKRFKEEFDCFSRFIGIVVACAFIGAFVGTLIWINGRGAWFVMRYSILPHFALSLSWTYILSLVAYGILGALMPLCILLFGRRGEGRVFLLIGTVLASYVLLLLWYPLFYSAQFVLVSLFALILSAGANCASFFLGFRRALLPTVANIALFALQLYFICFTLSFYLLN